MRLFTRLAVAGSLIAVLAFSALGTAAAQTVSATNFTRQVCAAVAAADESGKASTVALQAAVQAYKSTPSVTTAIGVRDALIGATQNVDQQLAAMLAAIQQAGTPTNDAAFVNALIGELEASRTAAQQLVQQATAIDTTSPSVFANGVQQVVTETKTISNQTRASARNNPAFKRTSRPLRPLVHFMTTTAHTCGKP